MTGEYEDIINLPHPVSRTRVRMSPMDRAAQFSPFAALTGYDAAVEETARLTCQRIELDEDARIELNEALVELARRLAESPKAAITHFVPDERKAGGSYVVTEGVVRRIYSQEGYLTLEGGFAIFFRDILRIRQIR